ncbi:MAG TPA: MCE family protein [Nocardioidaceae bacterium]|nr:MCE family protein [Nocardioidaceae bacterium]
MSRVLQVGAVLGLAVSLSACGPDLNNRVLPGAKGTGEDGYTITVELANVGNLVPNAEVKVNDRTVGTVKRIQLDGWIAKVDIGVLDSVTLSANTQARIGQKSLLGSEYVELTGPPDGGATLQDGATIPLASSGRYTDTEDLIATLSLWLNGGGLQHVQTITTEVNQALQGNEIEARELIGNLNRFVSGLDSQRRQIESAISGVDALAKRLAGERETLADALTQLPDGLRTLNRQRRNLTAALGALDDLSDVTTRVVRTSGRNLSQELTHLRPALEQINAAATSLPDVLDIAGTVLFPVQAVPYVVKGDFLNVAVTVDTTIGSLARGFVPGNPLDQALDLLQTALQAGNPLTGPLTDAVNEVTAPTEPPKTLAAPGTPSTAPAPAPTAPPSNPLQDLLGGLLGGGS